MDVLRSIGNIFSPISWFSRLKKDVKFCDRLPYVISLEGTARYAGLLLAPAESFGLRPRLFLPFGQKKELIIQFWPIFGFLWSPVITLVTFSSNISNNNKKTNKKIIKILKNFRKFQKILKSKKRPKNQKQSKKSKKKPKDPKQIQKSIKNQKNPKLSKMVKKSENLKKSQKISKNHFFLEK